MSDPHLTPSTVYPSLSYDDASTAIDWLCRAFGFTRRLVVPGPDSSIMHSELSLGPGVIMVTSSRPDLGRLSPRTLGGVNQAVSVQVDDPDTHFRRAEAAGAEIIRDLQDEEYGSRGYLAKDPEGHIWYFGTYQPGAHWTDDSDVSEAATGADGG